MICTVTKTGAVAASSCFHRHRTRLAMPYRRATAATLAPGSRRLFEDPTFVRLAEPAPMALAGRRNDEAAERRDKSQD